MVDIAGHIYYASGIFVIIKMIYSTVDGNKLAETQGWKLRFSSMLGRKPNDSEFRSKEELDTLGAHYVLNAFEIIWCLIGLALSGQQQSFAIFILASIASYAICRILAYNGLAKTIRLFINICKTILYLKIISNHF